MSMQEKGMEAAKRTEQFYVSWLSWRKVLAFFLRRPLVILIDHDGERTLRIARYGLYGLQATRMGFGIRTVGLRPGGKTIHGCYCVRWILVNDNGNGLEM